MNIRVVVVVVALAGCTDGGPVEAASLLAEYTRLSLQISPRVGGYPFMVKIQQGSENANEHCRIVTTSFTATLAGTPMMLERGYVREDSDSYVCQLPEAWTFTVPDPLAGFLVLQDESRMVSCDLSAVMGDGLYRSLDRGGVTNSYGPI